MPHRMLTSPLMNARRFARNIENAYRQMWTQWCLKRASAAKSEIRSQNDESSPNDRNPKRHSFSYSDFGFDSSFWLRILGFAINPHPGPADNSAVTVCIAGARCREIACPCAAGRAS